MPTYPIKSLRDKGASQSLILADILPFSEKTSSGTSVLIQGVECGTVNIPLHHVNLSSDLVTGLVVIGITPFLPFKGVHLLLGNDLAGDKVVVNPLVTDTPNIGETDDPIEQEIPDLYHKIINHFYWPGLNSDVSKFCKTCHTCQMVGKPNQSIPKAQLQPIPAFDEPFSRILIDCVGPLPRTKSGSEYLLTIMCTSTHFPEAIPLRNIKTKSIVKALIKFFTFVGLPKSVQSDQGSNFMSGIFQQVMQESGVKQYRSSAYHPESQGALARFHQTLKNMIRSYCFDTEKAWDEGIHLLLFAVRESVQESLGFSPFELVFGHSVCGPLKLLKFLSNDETPLNLLQYVSDFRNRLSRACEVARSNLKMSQGKMKARYDNHVIDRKFKPGDKVLALLQIPCRPLQARYFGPTLLTRKQVV